MLLVLGYVLFFRRLESACLLALWGGEVAKLKRLRREYIAIRSHFDPFDPPRNGVRFTDPVFISHYYIDPTALFEFLDPLGFEIMVTSAWSLKRVMQLARGERIDVRVLQAKIARIAGGAELAADSMAGMLTRALETRRCALGLRWSTTSPGTPNSPDSCSYSNAPPRQRALNLKRLLISAGFPPNLLFVEGPPV